MKHKKLVSFLLALCMVFPPSVCAQGDAETGKPLSVPQAAAQAGYTQRLARPFDSGITASLATAEGGPADSPEMLAEVLGGNAVVEGRLVRLTSDVCLEEPVLSAIPGETTLDLAGHTLSCGMTVIDVASDSLRIIDTLGSGKISCTLPFPAVSVSGISGSLLIDGVTVSGYTAAVYAYSGDVLIKGGTFSAKKNAVHNSGSTIRIEGGTYDAQTALYTDNADYHETVITGGTFSASERACRLDGGQISISGGTFTTASAEKAVLSVGEEAVLLLSGGTFRNTGGGPSYLSGATPFGACIADGADPLLDGLPASGDQLASLSLNAAISFQNEQDPPDDPGGIDTVEALILALENAGGEPNAPEEIILDKPLSLPDGTVLTVRSGSHAALSGYELSADKHGSFLLTVEKGASLSLREIILDGGSIHTEGRLFIDSHTDLLNGDYGIHIGEDGSAALDGAASIRRHKGAGIVCYGELAINQGAVTENLGGGVRLFPGAVCMLGAAPYIAGNTNNGQPENLYIPSEDTCVYLSAPLQEGAQIGLSIPKGLLSHPIVVPNSEVLLPLGSGTASFFPSDSPAYRTSVKDGNGIILQSVSTLLSGQVSDPDGFPLSDVVLTLSDAVHTLAETRSGTDGLFSLTCLLPDGAYQLSCTLPGYYDAALPVHIENGIIAPLSICLNPKPAAQTAMDLLDLLPDASSIQDPERTLEQAAQIKQLLDESGSTLDRPRLEKLDALIQALVPLKLRTESQASSIPLHLTPENILPGLFLDAEEIRSQAPVQIILEALDGAEDKADEAAAQTCTDDLKIAAYLNLRLFKAPSGIQITETGQAFSLSFTLPEALRGAEEYGIIRVHDKEAKRLACRLDGNRLLFETDCFSTYAIAARFSKEPAPAPEPEPDPAPSPAPDPHPPVEPDGTPDAGTQPPTPGILHRQGASSGNGGRSRRSQTRREESTRLIYGIASSQEIGYTYAAAAAREAVKTPSDEAYIRFINKGGIPLEALANLYAICSEANKNPVLLADQKDGNIVTARLTLRMGQNPPAQGLQLGIQAYPKLNGLDPAHTAAVYIEESAFPGMEASVALYTALSDGRPLSLYAYDSITGSFTLVQDSPCAVDDVGYVHFNLPHGGYFIVSDVVLT